MLTIDSLPLLEVDAFVTTFPKSLGVIGTVDSVMALLTLDAPAPVSSSDEVRGAVRALLRAGGYKPTGRGKPASEYLIRAVTENALRSINLAVDACNVASLHSGLPISVVDFDLLTMPLRVGLAPADSNYVFNASGQTIDVEGLLCLFDAKGPCANAVKDSQRTKTTPATTRTLSVIWGARALPGRTAATSKWYRSVLDAAGAKIEPLAIDS